MEDIENPYWTDLNKIHQKVYWNYKFLDIEAKEFVLNEHKYFDLSGKIIKLIDIIDDVLNKLEKENYESKEELINNIKEKKKLLKELLVNNNDSKKKFLETEDFYRDLFNFHLDNLFTKAFANEEPRFSAIMNDIQVLVKDKFIGFLQSYYTNRNSFFEANKYIIKVKKLFNF